MSVTGNPIALDTNRAIAILNGTPNAAAWISKFPELCLPVPVIGELRFGAANSGRAAANLEAVDRLVQRCRVLPADASTAVVYADLRLRLKRAGAPIPENDVWISAICVQHALALATEDTHFDKVEGLTVMHGFG
jgi:tRNA(fMet)-specific endonuclease VapC